MQAHHREMLIVFAAGIAFVVGACATGEEIAASPGPEDDGSGGRASSREAGANVETGGHEAGGRGGTPGRAAGSAGAGARPELTAGSGGGPSASGGAPDKGEGDAGAMASGGALGAGGRAVAGATSGGGAGGTTANQSVFADDFEGSAKSWISVPSDGWSVVSDDTKVFRQATLDTQFRVSSAGDATWTDQAVEARVKVLAFSGSSTSYFAGVFARFKDLDNHYFVALQSDRHVKIKKKFMGRVRRLTAKVHGRGAWNRTGST